MTRRTLFRLLVAFTLVWLGWAGWSLISRSYPYELRVLDDLGSPIASAVVDINGSQVGTTGSDGLVDLVWKNSSKVLEVSAPGHVSRMLTLNDRPEGRFDVVLKAHVLRGRVINTEGEGLAGAFVEAGAATDVSDHEGYFQIRGAEEGDVTVERAAWLPAAFEWKGGTGESVVELEPFTAKAVHINGHAIVENLGTYFQMAADTELNALMLDLKDETGQIFYTSGNQTAQEVAAVSADAIDLRATVQRAHDEDLYVIGRVVVFNDPLAASAKPDMAVWDSTTNAPYEANGQRFLDPTDPSARKYGLELAGEICESGVDEVQFDYVRFPDSRRDAATFDGGVSPEARTDAITTFLDAAVAQLHPMGCAVAADIFGYLTTAPDDGGIGQRWEDVAGIVDVVSPMLYPSHYHPEFFGFPSDQRPGDVVDQALTDGIERLSTDVIVRPWLQDFGYGVGKVRAQIDVVESYGLGWMLWNASSEVTVDALQPAE